MKSSLVVFIVGSTLWLPIGTSVFADDVAPLTYEEHIRPIFREYCFDCHGATVEKEANLDLRLVRFMLAGGDSGPAIVTGEPDQSLLLDRIRAGEMPPSEAHVPQEKIAVIERWIAEGANTARPEPTEVEDGVGITPEERAFWSFQPITRPEVPQFAPEERVRTPIDALLRDAMPDGLSFSPDADRLTLIKRVYFDLTGLPPTPEEVDRWMADAGDDWYERLVDEVLASPHYGEHWGRHWLDVAGYADSEGYTVSDADRSWAWKYRDYIIRSLNADKPFDRFVIEQLAGDELAGPIAGDLTPEQIELLTATGFLRMAADGTGSGANDPVAQNQVIADTIKIVSTSLLGMSMACAQCHDHRYDPILQRDYYAMRAVFAPALDWQNWRTPQQRLISLYTEADRTRAAEIEAQANAIATERAAKQAEYMAQALEQELAKFEEPLREQLRVAYETAADQRTPEQVQLLDQHPSVNISPGVLYQYLPEAAEDLKKYDERIAEVRAQKPPEEFLRVLTEPAGHLPATHLFHRGDHQQPQEVVSPAALTVVCGEDEVLQFPEDDPALPTSGRRLAYARWLTNGEHPLVARVIVNRVWMHHFGRGIVSTPADFGQLGGRPSHPALLDWLADEFVQQGWSLKSLHRLILSSTAWRQSSYRDPVREEIDPENQYYWRQSITRLEAEPLRDRMLAATGRLDRTLFGAPVAIAEDETGQVIVENDAGRRSLYVRVRRSQPVAMLQAFDAPVMETNCERRPVSTVATQSLVLMNSDGVLNMAAELAGRATRESAALSETELAAISPLPATRQAVWEYGYGSFDANSARVSSFTPLPHFTGSAWQGGPNLPDPVLGWAIINAHGGHPDIPERSVIRRWRAPEDGVITIAGNFSHGSENGNGVRGRIVSSQSGLLGEWSVFNGSTETSLSETAVAAGETIDFVTDSIESHNSDSYQWEVTVSLQSSNGVSRPFVSKNDFAGPTESLETLVAHAARAWQFALCRRPTTEELSLAADFLARQLDFIELQNVALPENRTASQQALINLCQALMSSNEFLYVE